MRFALRRVNAEVVELWSGNWKSVMEDPEKTKRPWVISFCGDGGGRSGYYHHSRPDRSTGLQSCSVFLLQGCQASVEIHGLFCTEILT